MAALPDGNIEKYENYKCIGTLTKNNKYRYTKENDKEFPRKKIFIYYNRYYNYKKSRYIQEIVLRDKKIDEKIVRREISNTSKDIGRFGILCNKDNKNNNICTLEISIDNSNYTKLKLSSIMIWILLDYVENVKNVIFCIDDDVSEGFWDSIGMIKNPNVENEDSSYFRYQKVISYKSLHEYADQQKKNYYESVENNTNKFIIDLTDKHSIAYRVTNSRSSGRSRGRSRGRSSDRSSDRSRSPPHKGGKHKTKKRSQH